MQSNHYVNRLFVWLLFAVISTCCDGNEREYANLISLCENDPCEFHVVTGEVKQVPTWHERDYAVELVGSPVELEYTIEERTISEITVELFASVDSSAELTLEVDFWDDGHIDCTHPIPENNWESTRFIVPAPDDCGDARLVLRKQGEGRVVIERLFTWDFGVGDVEGATVDCESEDYKAPFGVPCDSGDDCVSGICSPTVPEVSAESKSGESYACGECFDDGGCPDGSTCGVVGTRYKDDLYKDALFRTCITPRSRGIGQDCYNDNDCASGYCDSHWGWIASVMPSNTDTPTSETPSMGRGVCNECHSDSDCDLERVCGISFFGGDFDILSLPIAQCVFQGLDPFLSPCLSDSECAEGLMCRKVESLAGSCVECDQNTACPNGLICSFRYECIEPQSSDLGDGCASDDACESGICATESPEVERPLMPWGTCAECIDDSDCAKGQNCLWPSEETSVDYPTCGPPN